MTKLRNGLRRVAPRAVTTLVAWVAAYVIVGLVFTVGGRTLADAPAAARLLVVSGVLVIVMVNVLMPAVARLVAALFPPSR